MNLFCKGSSDLRKYVLTAERGLISNQLSTTFLFIQSHFKVHLIELNDSTVKTADYRHVLSICMSGNLPFTISLQNL